MTAAIIIGHTAGAQRFPTDGHFARHAGTAPVPASSGKTQRHRLHRGGDRQLNRAIHIIALSRAKTDPETRAYLARKHAEGKTKLEAIRCLKRHLARRPNPHPTSRARPRLGGARWRCPSQNRKLSLGGIASSWLSVRSVICPKAWREAASGWCGRGQPVAGLDEVGDPLIIVCRVPNARTDCPVAELFPTGAG